jgi:hypothetical protein
MAPHERFCAIDGQHGAWKLIATFGHSKSASDGWNGTRRTSLIKRGRYCHVARLRCWPRGGSSSLGASFCLRRSRERSRADQFACRHNSKGTCRLSRAYCQACDASPHPKLPRVPRLSLSSNFERARQTIIMSQGDTRLRHSPVGQSGSLSLARQRSGKRRRTTWLLQKANPIS